MLTYGQQQSTHFDMLIYNKLPKIGKYTPLDNRQIL